MMQNVSLDSGQWVQLINLLGEHPFRVSAPLILAIQAQTMMQPQPAPQQERPNGEVVEHAA